MNSLDAELVSALNEAVENTSRSMSEHIAPNLEIILEKKSIKDLKPKSPLEINQLETWKMNLIDLGYLKPEHAEDDYFSEKIVNAYIRYIRDDPALDNESPAGANDNPTQAPISATEAPGPVEDYRINELMSFDGDKLDIDLPVEGQSGLYTRVLHYKLRVLGLYNGGIADPVNQGTLAAIKEIKRLLPDEDAEKKLFDIIGDARMMSSLFLGRKDFIPLIIHSCGEIVKAETDLKDIAIIDGKFLKEHHEWHYLLRSDKDFYEHVKRTMRSLVAPARLMQQSLNLFGIQLIQLRLWMHGFYDGNVDGWWGPLSYRALLKAFEFAKINRKDAMRSLGGGYWALNPYYLEEALFGVLERADISLEACQEGIINESIYLKDNHTEKKAGGITAVFSKIGKGILKCINDAIAVGKKIYSGVKTLVKSAASAIANGYNWMKGKLEELAAPVVNFIRAFYFKARDGIKMAFEGMKRFVHFILGKPIVTSDEQAVVLTKLAIDCDSHAFVSSNAKPALVKKHIAHCRELRANLALFLKITGRVLGLAIDFASGRLWVSAAYKIGVIVFNALKGITVKPLYALAG